MTYLLVYKTYVTRKLLEIVVVYYINNFLNIFQVKLKNRNLLG